MNVIAIAKPDILPRLEPHLRALMPSVAVTVLSGTHEADFDLSKLAPELPVTVLGGCEETFDVLTWLASRHDVLPRIRWIHSYNVGVDGLKLRDLPPEYRHIPLSNARGASSYLLAEHVAMSFMYFNRLVPLRLAQQKSKNWRVVDTVPCHGRTVGILGYGDIGRNIARLARHGLCMNVLGYRTTVYSPVDDLGTRMLSGEAGLHELVRASDFIVNALPLTEATRNMCDRSFFGRMQPHSIFINVGRGATVVEEDLYEALSCGAIRGAALDVFQKEPLPQSSKLWELGPDRIFITAHDAAPNAHCGGVEFAMRQYAQYAREFVADQRVPEYLVNFDRGY